MSDVYLLSRFSEHAQRALICSGQEAEDGGAEYIGTDHLLLGLLRVGAGSGFRALQALGIDEMKLRADVEKLHQGKQPHELPFKGAKDAIEHAFRDSHHDGAATVRSGHLLAGIIKVDDATTTTLLKRQWLAPETVIAAVDRELRVTT